MLVIVVIWLVTPTFIFFCVFSTLEKVYILFLINTRTKRKPEKII